MAAVEDFLEAARKGEVTLLESMLAEDSSLLGARNHLGQSAVLLAKYHRQPAAVDFLLSKNPELTLHEACAVGAMDRVREIIRARGRLIDEHAGDGFTPLSLACYFGYPEIATYLVEQGASINLAANNPMKVAPIHAAVAVSQMPIVRMLVENGADVNARQQHGWTPLHAAAQNGDEEIVRLLLKKGADRGALSETKQSPMDLALMRGHGVVVSLLEG